MDYGFYWLLFFLSFFVPSAVMIAHNGIEEFKKKLDGSNIIALAFVSLFFAFLVQALLFKL